MSPSWVHDAVFYLIFPDRFARSSRLKKPSNLEPWESPPTPYGFKGGDLYGISERLDYLEDLGVNALLLNPVFTSAANHRYHTIDYFSVDPLLGGTEALRELIDAAHSRSMHVVLDGVFNHTGRGFYQFLHTLENGSSSPYLDWFCFNRDWLRENRQINAFPPVRQELDPGDTSLALEKYGYRAWWNLPALPKLNTENPEVRDFIFSVARHWLEFGADGWRLDVPSEIDDDLFWREFRRVVKGTKADAYILGEIWDDGSRWLKGEQFDGVMNYTLTKAMLGYLTGDSFNRQEIMRTGGYRNVRPLTSEEFGDFVANLLSQYPQDVNLAQLNLITSHDTPRFLSCAGGDVSALKLAVMFMMTFPGAPCIFYGDETGITGAADPGCRRSFVWEERTWNLEVQTFFKRFIELRKSTPALRRGSFREVSRANGIYAYARELEDVCYYIILNPSSSVKRVSLPAPPSSSGHFEDWWTGKSYSVMQNQIRDIFVEPRSGMVLHNLTHGTGRM